MSLYPQNLKPQTALKALASIQTLREQNALSQTNGMSPIEHVSVELPVEVLGMLEDLLSVLAQGQAVQIVPSGEEITTQKAADILNVSRPFLIKLLETGEIPFRKVGTHRRVRLGDVMAYKREDDAKRLNAVNELMALSEEMGLE